MFNQKFELTSRMQNIALSVQSVFKICTETCLMFPLKNAERATEKISTKKFSAESSIILHFFKEYLEWNNFKASSIKQISEN